MPQQTVFNSDFGIVFFAIIVVFLVSTLYPMNPERPFARASALSAISMLPLWWLYEQMMPSGINIRIDLLIFLPMIFTGLLLIAKRMSWLVGVA